MTVEKAPPKKLFADEVGEETEAQRSIVPVVLLALVFVGAGGVALFVQSRREPPQVRMVDLRKRIQDANNAPLIDTPMMLPGLVRPPAFAPKDSLVDDNKQVLGVSVNGKHRAYLLDGLKPLGQRVINDLVGKVPISVFYDPQKDVPRILNGTGRDETLSFNLGGYSGGDMFVMYREREYKIEGKMPFKDQAFERVTWKEWRDNHPDTDVYTGRDIIIPFSKEAEDREKAEKKKKKEEAKKASAEKSKATTSKADAAKKDDVGKKDVGKTDAGKTDVGKTDAAKKDEAKKDAKAKKS